MSERAMSLGSSGTAVPLSHLLTDCRVTPSESASCSWDIPFWRRSSSSFSENVFMSIAHFLLSGSHISPLLRKRQERGSLNFVNCQLHPLQRNTFRDCETKLAPLGNMFEWLGGGGLSADIEASGERRHIGSLFPLCMKFLLPCAELF